MFDGPGRVLGLAAAAAILLGVTACGGDDGPDQARATAAATTTAEAAATGSTPAGVTASWVTAVLENRYEAACELMVGPGKNGAPPERIGPDTCAQAAPTLDSLREAWKKDVVTLPAQVTVADVTPQGPTALVPDTGVLVNGHSLRDLQLIGATGGASLELSLALLQVDANWFVSDVEMDFGS